MTRIVTAPNRGTVHVVAGVLAGIGPTGPEGPVGPSGPATTITAPSYDDVAALLADRPVGDEGEAHIVEDSGHLYRWNDDTVSWENVGRVVGEPGQVQSVMAQFSDTAVQTIARNAWTTLTFTDTDVNDTTTYIDQETGAMAQEAAVDQLSPSSYSVPHGRNEAYLVIARATMTEGPSATPGQRRLRLIVGGQPVAVDSTVTEGSAQGTTELELVAGVSLNDGVTFSVQIWHDSIVSNVVDDVQLTVLRVGGGVGPQGQQGEVGPQGPQGVKGDPGSAGGGYVAYDDVTSNADSTASPGGTTATTDEQQLPVPAGNQAPHTPYFLRLLATALERFVVARMPDAETFNGRIDAAEGETAYVADTAQVVVRTGTERVSTVAYITSGESALIDGSASNEAEGTLYVQYVVG